MPRRDSTSSLTSIERLNSSVVQHHGSDSAITQKVDVVVVGAGLSGLNAAKDCHDKGLDVLVLEARDRIGGRTFTDEQGCDLGGCYIGHDQTCMMSLVHELGLKLQSNTSGYGKSNVYYDSCTNTTYRLDNCYGSFPHSLGFTNFLVRLDFLAARHRINRMCNQVPLAKPWEAKCATEWDSLTFKSFINDTCCFTPQVKQYILNSIMITSTTNDAADFSLLWALWYIRSWGGFDNLIGGGSDSGVVRVTGGSQLVCKRLCQQISEDRVLLNKRVVSIDQESRKDYCLVKTHDGHIYEAQHVIMAVPPNLQLSIEFKPSLPQMRKQLIQRMPAGLCSKVILYYEKPYWFDKRYSGNMIISRPHSHRNFNTISSSSSHRSAKGDRRRLSPSGDDQQSTPATSNCPTNSTTTTYPVSMAVADHSETKPAIIGFICGGQAWLQYSSEPDQATRIQNIAVSYSRILECPELAHPIGYKEKDWVDDEYALGAYTTIMTPGTMTKFGPCLRQNFGHIWFASSETSISWPCSMEGAVRSGKLAANQVKQAISYGLEVAQALEPDEEDVPLILNATFMDRHAHTGLTILKFACTAPTVLLITLALTGLVRGTCRLTLRM